LKRRGEHFEIGGRMVSNHAHLISLLADKAAGKIVVGCIAWFSSNKIIDQLSHCRGISILVILEERMAEPRKYKSWYPVAFWTGSMNFTENSKNNQENAMYIENEILAKHYFDDFALSFKNSARLRSSSVNKHT